MQITACWQFDLTDVFEQWTSVRIRIHIYFHTKFAVQISTQLFIKCAKHASKKKVGQIRATDCGRKWIKWNYILSNGYEVWQAGRQAGWKADKEPSVCMCVCDFHFGIFQFHMQQVCLRWLMGYGPSSVLEFAYKNVYAVYVSSCPHSYIVHAGVSRDGIKMCALCMRDWPNAFCTLYQFVIETFPCGCWAERIDYRMTQTIFIFLFL